MYVTDQELSERVIEQTQAWPDRHGFAWYLFDAGEEDECGITGEAIFQPGHVNGLTPPATHSLQDPCRARFYFKHGCPELILAIGTGTEPRAAAKALQEALRMPEDTYVASLHAPARSEARAQLVARLREILPTLIRSLRGHEEQLLLLTQAHAPAAAI
jgi:hypothetical protein